jgi:hypothetical protein
MHGEMPITRPARKPTPIRTIIGCPQVGRSQQDQIQQDQNQQDRH